MNHETGVMCHNSFDILAEIEKIEDTRNLNQSKTKTVLIPTKTLEPKSEQHNINNITISLLEKIIADYEEKYEIEIVTVEIMEVLVESLNEDYVLNQEKYKNEIKSMKHQYNVKYYHTKCEREINSKRIMLLETKNAKL